MSPRKPNCPGCGIKKTPENTSIQRSPEKSDSFMYLCKKCDTDRMLKAQWAKLSTGDLIAIRDKHLADYYRVKKHIEERWGQVSNVKIV